MFTRSKECYIIIKKEKQIPKLHKLNIIIIIIRKLSGLLSVFHSFRQVEKTT